MLTFRLSVLLLKEDALNECQLLSQSAQALGVSRIREVSRKANRARNLFDSESKSLRSNFASVSRERK